MGSRSSVVSRQKKQKLQATNQLTSEPSANQPSNQPRVLHQRGSCNEDEALPLYYAHRAAAVADFVIGSAATAALQPCIRRSWSLHRALVSSSCSRGEAAAATGAAAAAVGAATLTTALHRRCVHLVWNVSSPVVNCQEKSCQLFSASRFIHLQCVGQPGCDGCPVWPLDNQEWLCLSCNACRARHSWGYWLSLTSHSRATASTCRRCSWT